MKKFKFKTLLILVTLFSSASAFAMMPRYTLLGGVNSSTKTDTVEDTVLGSTVSVAAKPALGYQGGILVEFPLAMRVGFEFGALYLHIKTKVETTTTLSGTTTVVDTDSTANYLEFPVAFRFWFNRYLSLGAGGFYDLKLKKGNSNDYGYLGSLRLSFPVASSASFIVDGRYLGGLKSVDGFKSKYWQAMAGITFGMMK